MPDPAWDLAKWHFELRIGFDLIRGCCRWEFATEDTEFTEMSIGLRQLIYAILCALGVLCG